MGIIDFINKTKQEFREKQDAKLQIESEKAEIRTKALRKKRVELEKKAEVFEKESKEKERMDRAEAHLKSVRPNRLSQIKKGIQELKSNLPESNPFTKEEDKKENPWR